MTATVSALAAYRNAPGGLLHLVRCTAALDRQAFARLYDALKPAVTATVGELAEDPHGPTPSPRPPSSWCGRPLSGTHRPVPT